MTHPLISVLIPAYNAEKYIKDALDSVIATQYPNLEIIVVNDGSTDRTAEIVANYPTKIRLYHHQGNQGIPITRNRTLDLMTGDIFTFLDADDTWTPYKLDIQLQLLEHADVVLGQSRLNIVNLTPYISLLLSSGLYRRTVIEKAGRFDENLPIGEDTDWMFRIREAELRIVHHYNLVHIRRRHDTNTTSDIREVQKNNLKLIKLSLQRRRQQEKLQVSGFDDNFIPTPSDEELLQRKKTNGITTD